jgi:adenine deaminase
VQFGALSLDDLVLKACLNPARMLGLATKGHLGPGADADVIVVNPVTSCPEWVIANGQVVVREGQVVGKGGQMLTTDIGQAYVTDRGMDSRTVAPEWLR